MNQAFKKIVTTSTIITALFLLSSCAYMTSYIISKNPSKRPLVTYKNFYNNRNKSATVEYSFAPEVYKIEFYHGEEEDSYTKNEAKYIGLQNNPTGRFTFSTEYSSLGITTNWGTYLFMVAYTDERTVVEATHVPLDNAAPYANFDMPYGMTINTPTQINVTFYDYTGLVDINSLSAYLEEPVYGNRISLTLSHSYSNEDNTVCHASFFPDSWNWSLTGQYRMYVHVADNLGNSDERLFHFSFDHPEKTTPEITFYEPEWRDKNLTNGSIYYSCNKPINKLWIQYASGYNSDVLYFNDCFELDNPSSNGEIPLTALDSGDFPYYFTNNHNWFCFRIYIEDTDGINALSERFYGRNYDENW